MIIFLITEILLNILYSSPLRRKITAFILYLILRKNKLLQRYESPNIRLFWVQKDVS